MTLAKVITWLEVGQVGKRTGYVNRWEEGKKQEDIGGQSELGMEK
jgi:hypothetical protein